jgi:hypothetical protein
VPLVICCEDDKVKAQGRQEWRGATFTLLHCCFLVAKVTASSWHDEFLFWNSKGAGHCDLMTKLVTEAYVWAV